MQRRGCHWVSPSEGTLIRFGQSRSRPMALASCLVLQIPLSGCGMQRRGCHWVSPSEGTLLRFCQSRSRPMALASCLVLTIPLSWYGMQRQGCHWVSLSKDTLLQFRQSRSRPMALASCLVLTIPLSGCGMQPQRHNSKNTLKSIPLHLLHIDIAPFASPHAWNMHCAILLSYSRPPLMDSIELGLLWGKMDGW
jgi:hypothetical protein